MSTSCPICGRTVPPASAPPRDAGAGAEAPLPENFPFCSRRCRLVDLGRWFDGFYLIPGAPREVAGDGPGGNQEYQEPRERRHRQAGEGAEP